MKSWFPALKEPETAMLARADDQMLSVAVRYSLLNRAEDEFFCLFYCPGYYFLLLHKTFRCATICHIFTQIVVDKMLITR